MWYYEKGRVVSYWSGCLMWHSRLMLVLIEVAHWLDCQLEFFFFFKKNMWGFFFFSEIGRPDQEFDKVDQCQNMNFEVKWLCFIWFSFVSRYYIIYYLFSPIGDIYLQIWSHFLHPYPIDWQSVFLSNNLTQWILYVTLNCCIIFPT